MDENLAWLTQKNEEPKCNKGKNNYGNFTPPIHTVNECNWTLSNKRSGPPHFYINPPFSGLSPLSSTIFGPPQVTQLLGGLITPLTRGGGGFNYGFPCLICIYDVQIIFLNYFFELYILLFWALSYSFELSFWYCFFICFSLFVLLLLGMFLLSIQGLAYSCQ